MAKATILGKEAALLANLHEHHAVLSSAIADQRASDQLDAENEIKAIAHHAAEAMQRIACDMCDQMRSLSEHAHKAGQQARWAQTEIGEYRPHKKTDAFLAFFLVMIGWLIEAVFTTVSLFSDGYLDLIPALGFAATFSTVNVALGLLAGACLRYVNYRAASPVQKPVYAAKRQAARIAVGVIAFVDLVMIFTGGRVRVTGSHSGIFDFSEVGFFSTFSDGLALVIMVAAGLSFAIAAFKGHSGFVDPTPDYTDLAGGSTDNFTDDGLDLLTDAQADLDEIADGAENSMRAMIGPSDVRFELYEDVCRFNASVHIAKQHVRVFAQAEWERRNFIDGAESHAPQLNLRAFDQLLIDPDSITPAHTDTSILDTIRHAHSEAMARVRGAFAEFRAGLGTYRISPPQH